MAMPFVVREWGAHVGCLSETNKRFLEETHKSFDWANQTPSVKNLNFVYISTTSKETKKEKYRQHAKRTKELLSDITSCVAWRGLKTLLSRYDTGVCRRSGFVWLVSQLA